MHDLGYDQLVCDIFTNWEGVKDEILIPERKAGSGNGTIHIFLGAANEALQHEFPNYYDSVKNEQDAANGAIEITHYFLRSNVISMLGYVCQYNFNYQEPIEKQVSEVLSNLRDATDGNILSTKSLFKLSTGASKLRPYFKQFESNGVFSKVIRKILLPNTSYKISLYKNKEGKYAAFWLIGFDDFSDFEADSNSKKFVTEDNTQDRPRQIIFYGAPGTGKSHGIKTLLNGVARENIFRTTFHPDSDYSTFVGAYKPTMRKEEDKPARRYDIDDLAEILKERYIKADNKAVASDTFGLEFAEYLDGRYGKVSIKSLLEKADLPPGYNVSLRDSINLYHKYLKQKSQPEQIAYDFTPQAFVNAYERAYQTDENVYLIIEEINRGNCAQIFGDLFQLLDRDDEGRSDYTIKADTDLRKYLIGALGEDSEGIKDGELCLPPNLYIWATMNTSDQSLFPIDSAFKRRWDWKYIPIQYGNTDWKIDIDGNHYSWVDFQRKVNDKIYEATQSEDKKLGDYFVKAVDNVISKDMLLNKVLFYLWNDVCKDGEGDIFKIRTSAGDVDVTFSALYDPDGTEKLKQMMAYLEVSPETTESQEVN